MHPYALRRCGSARLTLHCWWRWLTAELTALSSLVESRAVFGQIPQPWQNKRNLLDAELLHIHRPNYHAKGRLRGGGLVRIGAPAISVQEYDVRYDQHGFRNEVDYEQARCIIIGDSVVEAGGVQANELVSYHLADSLQVPVANLGQSHYGPQQELHVLKRFGLPLRPAVCLWVFFEGNDLADVWRYEEMRESWPDSVTEPWHERSFAVNGLRWLRSISRKPTTDRSGVFLSRVGPQRLWFGYAGKPLSARNLDALAATTRVIADAHALCEQNRIHLIVAFAPTKFRVYADYCEFPTPRGGALFDVTIDGWSVNDLPERLANSVNSVSSKIAFLDLTPHLKAAAADGRVVYYPDDTHWSPIGHEVVAEETAALVRSKYEDLLVDDRRELGQ